MKKTNIKRGDLFYFDFKEREGSIQSGLRPVLVIQADEFNANAPTIIVASITAVIKKRYLPSHIFLGENYGLKKPSMVLLEQIQTVNKKDLSDYIGTIDDNQLLKRVDNTLKKTFGLWKYKKINEDDVRCLCPSCLKDYIASNDYLIRRRDPFARSKSKCDKCGRLGWQYIVKEKDKTKAKSQ